MSFESIAFQLWKGLGINCEEMTAEINTFIDKIVQSMPILEKNGIEFPTEYVKNALVHTEEAIAKRDDYQLADSLYFEWNEIEVVFNELLEEVGLAK